MDAEFLERNDLEELHRRFVDRLRNKNTDQKPYLVCFSGVPLSGKSTLAKLLQHRYDMVRIENDAIRGITDELGIETDIYRYLEYLLKNYDFSNKRVVLDSSIDRTYPEITDFCDENDIPCFIIQMPIPGDYEQRAKERSGTDWQGWLEKIKENKPDYQEAAEDLSFDFRFGKDGGTRKLLEVLDGELEKADRDS